MNEYLFDVKLNASLRVRAADEAEARSKLAELLDCANVNFGAIDGEPVIGEASADGEPYLAEETALGPRYVAGWNMPGYLPDMEPAEFDNAQSAANFLADEMERVADEPDAGGPYADKLRKCAAHLREGWTGEFGRVVSGCFYWIEEA